MGSATGVGAGVGVGVGLGVVEKDGKACAIVSPLGVGAGVGVGVGAGVGVGVGDFVGAAVTTGMLETLPPVVIKNGLATRITSITAKDRNVRKKILIFIDKCFHNRNLGIPH